MAKIKILVVEDESIVAKDLQNTLQNLGYKVPAVVSSGQAAIEAAEKHKPDLVLMDIVLKGKMDGIEAAEQIRSRFNIPVVYLTAYTDDKTLERAKITDPFGYIVKPFDDRQLKTVIEMAVYKAELDNKLKESEEWLSTTLKSIGDGVIATDEKGCIKFMNSVAQSLTGCNEADVAGKPLNDIFNAINEKTKKRIENPAEKVIKGDVVVELSNHTILLSKDQREITINYSAAPIRDNSNNIIGVVLILRDVSDRKKAEEKLKASLKEKEILLRELHHRVKNNMQVISSLLRLQSGTLDNDKAIAIFKECQNRVRSMALIHEKFYRSKDLTNIDFNVYVKELTQNLIQSYGISPGKITVDINVKDVSLGINTAVPCGLLINELISNSLKHAFPKKTKGQIKVSLQPVEKNQIELVISDNGVGIPDKLDFRKTESLGLQLINTLVKDQLDGAIELDKSAGTKFKITFKETIGGGK
ncbi:MAG: histidine kinase dimerization/phosphoacceptor domain -containing protein [Planctomycetota bacterium]